MSLRNPRGQRNYRLLENSRPSYNSRRYNRNEIYNPLSWRPNIVGYQRQECEYNYTIAESNKLCKNCDKVKIIIQRTEKANHDNQSSKSMCYTCHNNN